MPNYIVRDVPQEIFDRFRARVVAEHQPPSMREVLISLMADYGRGRITPGRSMAKPTTLIVVLDDSLGTQLRVDGVDRAFEVNGQLEAIDGQGLVMARFGSREVRRWHVE